MPRPVDRWQAVRRGPRYCAPACGARCTWAAYQRAVTESRVLARRLGPGWVPQVWENMGWFWKVSGHGITLRKQLATYYGVADALPSVSIEGASPRKVVQQLRTALQDERDRLQEALDRLDAWGSTHGQVIR